MIIVLNGPLGIGKSALVESIDQCVMLDGDHVVAVNPPPADETAYLHATIALLVAHHRRFGRSEALPLPHFPRLNSKIGWKPSVWTHLSLESFRMNDSVSPSVR